MQNINIEELKAQVIAAQEANLAKISQAATVSSLQAMLKAEQSESLFNAKVALMVSDQQTEKLQQLVDECAAIIANVPVHNNKTRTARVWAGSKRFQYGTQVNLAYQLATGILYSCAEHKPLLLAHTGLSLGLLEQLVEAFGTPSYYSRTFNTIVEAKPYEVEYAKQAVEVMQSTLQVSIDSKLITSEEFSLEFGKAQKSAYDNKKAAEEAIADADLEL